ncbi:Hypothetical protein MVR_LOCUS100 [uncultured virus]|nr:Hypothetical protein MVR_LOCUS100 [uncultured virus]
MALAGIVWDKSGVTASFLDLFLLRFLVGVLMALDVSTWVLAVVALGLVSGLDVSYCCLSCNSTDDLPQVQEQVQPGKPIGN